MTAKLLKRRSPARAKPATGRAKPRRAADDGHEDIRLWLRLLFCASHIESIMQSRIMNAFGISLARFDLLSQLERVGGGLTMSEVSRRMMVSNGATTSLADKLVEDGLVQRKTHPEDRRTTLLHLTDQGRGRFLAMAREHENWIVELLEGLDESAKQRLLSSLAALKRHLEKLEVEV